MKLKYHRLKHGGVSVKAVIRGSSWEIEVPPAKARWCKSRQDRRISDTPACTRYRNLSPNLSKILRIPNANDLYYALYSQRRLACMPAQNNANIKPAEGKLGVLLVGLGAVSTTFIAGVEAVKKGFAQPIGSLTQMGTIRLGKRTENRVPLIKNFVPLADLKDLVFGAWDIFPESAYEAALNAGVLEKELLAQLREPLRKIKPMKAVFDQSYVKRLSGTNVKTGKNKFELAQQLIDEIAEWKRKNKCSRVVMIWAASTEIFLKPHPVHKTLETFEKAMRENHKAIAPSMIYACAALKSGIPFANGAPNLTVDIPALMTLADKNKLGICGKDFKTGQTLMKTIVAPGLKSRMLGLHGWYSTNILGNRDGEVLDDPDSFKTKEESKLSVLEYILQPE